MTATTQREASAVASPAARAQWVLLAVVALNVLIVQVAFFTSDPAPTPLRTVGRFIGVHAALLLLLQLTLVARLPWLDRRIGMDRLTVWHRWTGFALLWTVLAHVVVVVLGFAVQYDNPFLVAFLDLAATPAALLGVLAATGMAVMATTSIRYARRRLSYEAWHAIHFLVYAVLVFAFFHQLMETTTFAASPLVAGYWWTLWALVVAALVVGRFIVPIWRNFYHRFRVVKVVPESENVVSVYISGRHLDRLPARAGQFCIWRFLGHNRWWQANPFSLSAAPDGQTLRLTAKAVGSTSAGLRHVPVGTRVFVEGPYGAFTSLQRTRQATLLIAGGVGITPIRALLEELPGPVHVLYRVHTTADAVLLDELQELARTRGAQLQVLTGRTGAGSPPNTPFAPENLLARVPDITDRDVFVCGPPAMTDAVLRSLDALRVPRRQVHAEKFSLA